MPAQIWLSPASVAAAWNVLKDRTAPGSVGVGDGTT
jgi:hypothetical protein